MGAPLWLPGAIIVRGHNDGGSMLGGAPRMVWHSYEADPKSLSAKRGAEKLADAGNDLHLVLNPISGELAQMLPANRAGRGLKNAPGGVQTNRHGNVCIQIEVIAFASKPFTDYITEAGVAAVRRIVAWARSHGIPEVWPAGSPVSYSPKYPASHYPRPIDTWVTKAGHYSHSQVPENYHGDPGAINISVLRLPPAPPPKNGGTVVTATKTILTRELMVATPMMTGPDVKAVQKAVGMPTRDQDGVFWNRTEAAVAAFQRKHGLPDDGIVGKRTCAKLSTASHKFIWRG